MFNNPYNFYNTQPTLERINAQINDLEKMKEQIQRPTQQPITQNFQISPSGRDGIRYANSMEEVQRDMVFAETPFFSKDMTVLWIKDQRGNIKTYELAEIMPKDEKDIQIETLKARIEALESRDVKNEPSDDDANEPVKNEKSANVSTVRRTTKK